MVKRHNALLVAFYVVSDAALASLAFLQPGSASYGASGAVFGLMGATLVVLRRFGRGRDVTAVLVILGLYVRLTITETPVFSKALDRHERVKVPMTEVLKNQPGTVDEYPNWRVPLSGPDQKPLLLEDVFGSARARAVAAAVSADLRAGR